MPILKQLVSGSSQSKRRSRADLTAEMISAPLGDFRHTMHVGRGGDAFGDTSFLSSRSGEPPREAEAQPGSPGPKPGLLSRTFRSSKRSQSVNRADSKRDNNNALAPPTGSPAFVKNAVSLPHLNDGDEGRGGARVPKSLSSSPLKKGPDADAKPANGAAAAAGGTARDPELDERSFGELTDLPPSAGPRGGGGMKHAESIMSFHIDLGPSMLGDILSVMDKKAWDDDDLGYEEGKNSEGRASPPLSPPGEGDDEEEEEEEDDSGLLQPPPTRPPRATDPGNHTTGPYTLEPRSRHHHHLDSCSVSSAGSAALEEKPLGQLQGGDSDSAKFSSPQGEDEKDFSFMDEDDDEIRV
ncbi:cdc42 effector protein 4 [Megalops cyprinoides]|uniref:cdc42 effector protein 4 n=1 Tax=Megalops cyprinoides TaxID=118141 RepID=UPI001864449C|nr:cdc42 effector protein 4 [Megalops cyprinoides]